MPKPTIQLKVEKVQPDGTPKWVAPSNAATGAVVTDIARSVPLPKARKPKQR